MADRVISTDSHVLELPDLWSATLGPRFGDRAPHVVSDETGDWWYADNRRVISFQPGTQAGVRFEGQDKLKMTGRWKDVRPGAYIPSEKLKDMDLDGIYGEVVYPTAGLDFFRLPDGELQRAIFQVYNDWVAEFCAAYPARIKAVGMLNLDDINHGISDLRRAAHRGLVGAMITVAPPEGRSYDHPMYDPFWAEAHELGLPLSLHVATNRVDASASSLNSDPRGLIGSRTPGLMATNTYWVQLSIASMVLTGVFERYPKLKIVSVEHESGWAPYLIRSMDYVYTQKILRPEWPRYKSAALPSDFFHSNVFISFEEDEIGIQLRGLIGVDNLMWGSDYPHVESTFPRSRQILASVLRGVPDDEQEKITFSNAAVLYDFA